MKIRLSDYFKVDDIREPRTLTIRDFKTEEFGKRGEDKQQKLVVLFEEDERGVVMPLRGVAIKGLAKALGLKESNGELELGEAKGRKVELYVDENVSFEGRLVGGLRFRAVK